MKKSQLQQLINECIVEVLAEDKKTAAIKEIKRIIAENELEEIDLKALYQKGKDIANQTLGMSSKKDKEAAEKSFDEVNAKAKTDQSKNKAKWLERAKGYSYLGKFVIGKNGELAWNGESAAPKTINPNPTGAK
jgi:hypothetical protein